MGDLFSRGGGGVVFEFEGGGYQVPSCSEYNFLDKMQTNGMQNEECRMNKLIEQAKANWKTLSKKIFKCSLDIFLDNTSKVC